MSDPLDQFFGIKGAGSTSEEPVIEDTVPDIDNPPQEKTSEYDDEMFDFTVEIPDDVELSSIAKLALDAYKQQMQVIRFIEPKFRNRSFEVAQHYLTIAQNAIRQEQELKQKDERLDFDKVKAKLAEPEDESGKTNRSNLYEVHKKSKL